MDFRNDCFSLKVNIQKFSAPRLPTDLTETKYHLRRWKNYTRELDMIVVAVAIIEQNRNP